MPRTITAAVASPPSAIGSSTISAPGHPDEKPRPSAAATSNASRLPFRECGATRICTVDCGARRQATLAPPMRPRFSIASLLGHAFWLPALCATALGLWLPGDCRRLAPLVPISLGGILYFTALKVELRDVARQFHGGPRLVTLGGAAL